MIFIIHSAGNESQTDFKSNNCFNDIFVYSVRYRGT